MIQAPNPVPAWLPELAEALAGQRVLENDVSEVVPVETLFQLRKQLQTNPGSDYYSGWARWFFADRQGRSKAGFFELSVNE